MTNDILEKFDQLTPEQQYLVFVQTNLSKDSNSFISSAREKKYSVGMTDQTYRVIGTWVDYGLLDNPKDGSKWKKFSLLDLLWIKIIDRLRDFGYPVRSIEKVMQTLFYSPDREVWYNLDFALWQVTTLKKEIDLIVLANGQSYLGEIGEIEFRRKHDGVQDFILINFSNLVKELATKKPLITQVNDSPSELPNNEIELLNTIKNHKYSQVEITLSNGKIQLIKASENVDVNQRIVDLLKKGNFQEISIKQTNGKVVSVKRTTTKKV